MKLSYQLPKVALALALTAGLLMPAQSIAMVGTNQNTYQPLMLPINGYIETNVQEKIAMSTPPLAEMTTIQSTNSPATIDNDQLKPEANEEKVEWKEIPDSPGKTQINAGTRFPISIITTMTSQTAKKGDVVTARLNLDLKIGGRLVAKKGATVLGHITNVERARALLHSELSLKRWMRANGALGIQFDEIITEQGEHLPLVACPARQARIVKNKAEGRVLGVNAKGEIASPLSIQLKHQALHLGIRLAASAGGVFSFGIVPVAYGAVGAINPSFAFMHPVGQNVPHRRLKGFAVGVVNGLPCGSLIVDSIIHGQEAIIKPGDQFLAELQQDFTGESSTTAELVPDASKKVHGEIVKTQ